MTLSADARLRVLMSNHLKIKQINISDMMKEYKNVRNLGEKITTNRNVQNKKLVLTKIETKHERS